MPCKHASLAAIYAKQMAEMDDPWKLWRGRPCGQNDWVNFRNHFMFLEDWEIELIPKTITINGIEVPEPMREKPQFGTYYFFIYASERFYDRQSWTNAARDNFRLESGLCHSTKESAIIHAKALFSFSEGK